ncbi:hypothetical protein FXO37_34830 [Capsicum annuum]|nr:hypothetical protein FXO37_34830 [Capsicum annuum]
MDIDTIKMVVNLSFFKTYPWGKESFALTLDYLKKRIDFSRQKKTFVAKGVLSFGYTKSFSCLAREMRVHPYLIPTVREMKQRYMRKFKTFMDKLKNTFIDGLKAYLEGVTVITSSEKGEDGDDDRDLGRNTISRYVTQGAGISKPRAPGKTPMIKNPKERVFRIKESIKDIIDFAKEERLRRAEKEKQKKRDKDEAARVVRDDNGIKEALLETTTLEQASINVDEVMIFEVAAVVEKENLDKAGVKKEDHDEGRQDEEDKNEKSICEEENNEEDGEKPGEKNA